MAPQRDSSAAEAFVASVDLLVERIADRVAERLGVRAPIERIPLADVATHGVPSRRWVEDRARRGEIEIHGPRGARFVFADELEALLARTTIERRRRPPAHGVSETDDASAVVADLAGRRARRRSA
jgi:hypothetical protein